MEQYVNNSSTVKEIDNAIADLVDAKLTEEHPPTNDVERLLYFNIITIDGLDKALNENKDEIIAFAKEWLKRKEEKGEEKEKKEKEEFYFSTGISTFYLCYVLAGSTQENDKVIDYLKVFRTAISDLSATKLAKKVIDTYEKISGE